MGTSRDFTIDIMRADLRRADHADALVMLLAAYATDPMGGGNDLTDYTKQNLAAALLARQDAITLLAYAGDQPVGLLNAFEGFSTFACKPLINIHDVTVLPAFRGNGISRQLFAAIEAVARERDCCKLTLEVLEGNTVARAAYANFGYRDFMLDPKVGKTLFWEKKL